MTLWHTLVDYTRPFQANTDPRNWPFGRDSLQAKIKPFDSFKALNKPARRSA